MGIRSRFVDGINGTRMHVLEAGFETPGRPCVLLLHGFPELAYSWTNALLPLASAGYGATAPDLRGYGRTTGWNPDYDGDLGSFSMLSMVRDALALVSALGYGSVAAIVGRDAGSALAGWCALIRPDVFRSVVMLTAPFTGAPAIGAPASVRNIDQELAALPRPRKYYQRYYTTREASGDMRNCPQGLRAFFRGYFYAKSGDWKQEPSPLPAQGAGQRRKWPRCRPTT